MSPDELRKVFHVDRHELVPEYEVVTVHAATPYTSYQEDNIGPPSGDAARSGKVPIADIWSVLSEFSKKDDLEKTRRGPDNVEEIEEEAHDRVMKFSAFGKDLELKLKKTSGLFGKGIRMWETHGNSSNAHGIEYRELPQVSTPQTVSRSRRTRTEITAGTRGRVRERAPGCDSGADLESDPANVIM